MKRSDGEKGATMVEIIMILGILGALSVSIATLVNSMYDRYRVSRVCGQIEEFKKLINNRYIADGRYSNVSVATVIEEGIAPKDMVSGKKLYHSYNGEEQGCHQTVAQHLQDSTCRADTGSHQQSKQYQAAVAYR